MKEQILSRLDNPLELEKLYRENKSGFKKAFDSIYPDISDLQVARFWNERLNFEQKDIAWGSKYELLIVVCISLVAGIIAKIPDFFSVNEEFYYPRNIAFIVFPMLIVYFAWKNTLNLKRVVSVFSIIAISALYINFLPDNNLSDTLILACIHLPLFLWAILGFTFTGNRYSNFSARIDFLRYNGDLVVISAVTLIAGGLFSAVTVGLFDIIGVNIEEVYFRHIAIWGLVAVPVVGTFLVRVNPQLVKNVSPVIAKVFTPLVLIMLVVYLSSMIYTGKDPYNDREFLLVFNILLIGVMAIILFSVAETSKQEGQIFQIVLLFLLALVTIIVNGIALSAIVFRISEWGITPNRLAVMGGNILILINLLMVTYKLFQSLKNPALLNKVENSIAWYLPVYSTWAVIVTFLFPLIFNFK